MKDIIELCVFCRNPDMTRLISDVGTFITKFLFFPFLAPLLTVLYHRVFCNALFKFLSCSLIPSCHLRLVMKVVFPTLI